MVSHKSYSISIITPVYNGEKFIESCLKVVIEQNCPNIEHIIVDGSSSDKTLDIVKLYAKQYPHIKWISEKDKGQSDAMNKGIAQASAKIIGILNVDDYYEPNVLQRVEKIFQTLPDDSMLVGNCNVWNNDGKLIGVNKPKKLRLQDLLLGYDINPMPLNPSSYFYHKSLHTQVGLYNPNEHYGMDLEFLLRAVQVANVKYIDETWGNFCKHEYAKTVLDEIAGKGVHRRERIYNECVKNLPISLRIRMYPFRIMGYIYSLIWLKILYFYRHPNHLIPSIKKKLKK